MYVVTRLCQQMDPHQFASLRREVLGKAADAIPNNLEHDEARACHVTTGPVYPVTPETLKQFGVWEQVKANIARLEQSGRDLIEEVRPRIAAVW